MTDCELLEAAAKAAGMDVGKAQHNVWFYCEHGGSGAGFYRVSGNIYEYWNPLISDGDALRLAVALGMNVEPGWAIVNTKDHPFGLDFQEPNGDDPMAATRRAIVRAAAEIGNHGTP
jgi:hypothetical protein